jgi:hypothetical protein
LLLNKAPKNQMSAPTAAIFAPTSKAFSGFSIALKFNPNQKTIKSVLLS